MKIRKFTILFCATILLFSHAAPVEASPPYQDPQDSIIRQILTSTATDLGWNTTINYMTGLGNAQWSIESGNGISIIIFGPPNAGWYEFHVNSGGQPYSLHEYQAVLMPAGSKSAAVTTFNDYNIRAYGDTPTEAKDNLEAIYRNARNSGFIPGGPVGVQVTVTETTAPTIALTAAPGGAILLKATAEGYSEVIESIDNSANFESVEISGRVTSAATGAEIGGAVIEVVSGASYASTISAADGSYSLTAIVIGGVDSGMVSGIDFALPIKADLTIEVLPAKSELLADGSSSTDVVIQVKDLQGNPLKDRAFNLEVSGTNGPGTIQPAQASTDANGKIYAIYTAFKLAAGFDTINTRHEVTITAHDNTTGLTGSNTIFVNQYQVAVLFSEYIPACIKCDFPSKFSISVSDYWNNPIPNLPLSLRIEGGNTDAALVSDPGSNLNQQTLSLTTDGNGRAAGYFKWKGSLDISEAIRQVVIVEGITNSQVTKAVQVHGLDIGIGRIKEAGFTGVTGQQAFFKIYFKELVHPDLPLDRFNADSPNKLGMRVTISQYHSDGVNTSLTYEQTGGWEQDDGGTFVKMYGTPHMPYIIPVNDGFSWYEVRVDPVIDQDVFLPDQFRDNNDNIFALTTGSPDGWLHIWLQDGILTPHTWEGVVLKCVGRFLPVLGNAMTIIETLNQTYNQDVLNLGQSTAQVITDAFEKSSTVLPTGEFLKKINQTKASTVNNIVSCLQDSYAVYKEGNQQGSTQSIKNCSLSPSIHQTPIHFPTTDDADLAKISSLTDRFVQGILLDSPEQRGVVIYGLQSGNVTMLDSTGKQVVPTSGDDAGGDVLVYFLPVDDKFQLDVSSDIPFSIGIYQPGSADTNRTTIRHDISTSTSMAASMDIYSSSSFDLKIDKDNDGVVDQTVQGQVSTLDVVKPQITSLQPAQIGSIRASYADNPGGVGIDVDATKILVDGVDLTFQADVQPGTLALPLAGLEAGEHRLKLIVSDLDGNGVFVEKTFIYFAGFAVLTSFTILLIVLAVILVILLGLIVVIVIARKRRSSKRATPTWQIPVDLHREQMTQDKQGVWWHKDSNNGVWSFFNGQSWQMVPTTSPGMTAHSQLPIQKKRGGGSCLLSLLVGAGIGIIVIAGLSLIGLHFFPAYHFTRGQGDLTQILKMGGGGLLLALLGFITTNSGFKALINKRAIVVDEYGNRREKQGCSAVLQGLGQLVIGIVCLAGGFGLMTLVFFQEVVPLLGF